MQTYYYLCPSFVPLGFKANLRSDNAGSAGGSGLGSTPLHSTKVDSYVLYVWSVFYPWVFPRFASRQIV